MALSPHDTSFGSGLVAATDDDAAGRDAEGVLSTTVFCDLDGVLCDFDRGCVAIMGTTPDQLSRKSMWTGLARAASFCECDTIADRLPLVTTSVSNFYQYEV